MDRTLCPLGRVSNRWRYFLPLAATLLALCCPPTSASEIQREGSCTYFLSGPIDAATPIQVRETLSAANATGCDVIFRLGSNGGDVRAAIEVGDLFRKAGITTIIPLPAACASACVVAFLGGSFRYVAGRVGLHRPYPILGAATPAAAGARRGHLDAELRTYLSRMSIPARLIDEMNAVPSGSIRWLDGSNGHNGDEISRLQISGDDPAWAEYRDSRRASDLGISLPEYYKRQQRSEVECSSGSTQDAIVLRLQCRADLLAGKR